MTEEQQQPQRPKAEEITLSDEDEAILDRIWDEIAAEEDEGEAPTE